MTCPHEETTLSGHHLGRAAIAFLLSLPLLTGCSIDKGTALAEDFEQDWSGTPDVESVQTTHDNTLPFTGTATGTLTLPETIPADRVTATASRLRRYVSKHGSVTGRIQIGTITFTVPAEQERLTQVLALWRSLSADERQSRTDIAETSGNGGARWAVESTAVDPA
ncbi:hypothetical protein ACFQ07_15175, partial [Actinomadura adrarensis]